MKRQAVQSCSGVDSRSTLKVDPTSACICYACGKQVSSRGRLEQHKEVCVADFLKHEASEAFHLDTELAEHVRARKANQAAEQLQIFFAHLRVQHHVPRAVISAIRSEFRVVLHSVLGEVSSAMAGLACAEQAPSVLEHVGNTFRGLLD